MAARKPVNSKKPMKATRKPAMKPVRKPRRRDDSVRERTFAPARFRLLSRPGSQPITGVKVTDGQGTMILDKSYPPLGPGEWAEHLQPEMNPAQDNLIQVTVTFQNALNVLKNGNVLLNGPVDIEVDADSFGVLNVCIGPWPLVGQSCLL